MRAYSKKNGWKLASPADGRNGGKLMGSLVGICGRVLRVAEDNGLDAGRSDGASPAPDLDILKLLLLCTTHQPVSKIMGNLHVRTNIPFS